MFKNDLLWKDEKGPSSVRRTLELFQIQAGEISDKRGGARLAFSERMDTILNWTKKDTDKRMNREGKM